MCTYLRRDDDENDAHGREAVDADQGGQQDKDCGRLDRRPPQVVDLLDAIKNPGMARAWSA